VDWWRWRLKVDAAVWQNQECACKCKTGRAPLYGEQEYVADLKIGHRRLVAAA
jgi:hypothetical protein